MGARRLFREAVERLNGDLRAGLANLPSLLRQVPMVEEVCRTTGLRDLRVGAVRR